MDDDHSADFPSRCRRRAIVQQQYSDFLRRVSNKSRKIVLRGRSSRSPASTRTAVLAAAIGVDADVEPSGLSTPDSRGSFRLPSTDLLGSSNASTPVPSPLFTATTRADSDPGPGQLPTLLAGEGGSPRTEVGKSRFLRHQPQQESALLRAIMGHGFSPTAGVVESVSGETGLTTAQVRKFFDNQRQRVLARHGYQRALRHIRERLQALEGAETAAATP